MDNSSRDYRIKDRSAKVDKRRNRMPDDNRGSIATIQRVIIKRGREAVAKQQGRGR